jgi:chromosome segregation ATPase
MNRSLVFADLAHNRTQLEKGLADLHGKCVSQRNQIKTLRTEKDKLQKELELQKALHALNSGPQLEGSSADLTQLRNKCATLQQDLEKSKKFTSTQNSCILELNAKLSAAQERLKAAEGNSTTTVNGEQPSDATALRTELTQKDSRVLALEADVAKEKKRSQEKDAKIQELLNQIAQTTHTEAPSLNKAHLAELQAEREKTADVTRRLEDAIRVRRKQEEEITALEAAKEEMDDEMLGLRDQLRLTKEQLEKAAMDLDWAENEKGDLEEDLLEIMRETGLSARDSFETKKKRIAQLEQDLAETRELLEGYQAEQTDEANKYEKLEERLANTRQKLNEANGQKKTLQNRVTSLGNVEKKLKKELESLRAENRELQRANQQASSKKDSGSSSAQRELRDENDRLQKENRKSAAKVDELKEETQELRGQLEDAQRQRMAAESEVLSLEKALAKSKEAFKKLEADKKDAGKRANDANYEMIKQKEAAQKLTAQIEDLRANIRSHEREKKDLAKRLLSAEAKPGDSSKAVVEASPSTTSARRPVAPKEEKILESTSSRRVAETPKTGNDSTTQNNNAIQAIPKVASPAVKRKVDAMSKGEDLDNDRTSTAVKGSDSRSKRSRPSITAVEPSEVVDISMDEPDEHTRTTQPAAGPSTSRLAPSTPSGRTRTSETPDDSLQAEDFREWVETEAVLEAWYPGDICGACS